MGVDCGPVDGRGPPVLGQQGGVDVDAPLERQRQNLVREDTAVGRHHNQLRSQLPQNSQGGPIPQLFRLVYRNTVGLGAHLHRRGLELVLVPPHRLVRLAEHPNHLVLLDQRLQRGDGKFRSPHENDSHLLLLLRRLAFSSFSSWDMISSSSSAV